MKVLVKLMGVTLIFSFMVSCTKDKIPPEDPVKTTPLNYCDSIDSVGVVSFKCKVMPIIETHCYNVVDTNQICHENTAGVSPPHLGGYVDVDANKTIILNRIKNSANPMPPASVGGLMDDSLVQIIETWINDGAKDN